MIKRRPFLFAGIDNLSLDKRKFDPSRDDIERVCRFFAIGKLRHHEKEKGIIVSHSNFFVFAVTTHGCYAFKFYPPDAGKPIAVEYAVNRILINHHFPTPIMYTGPGGQPFFASNGRLATCYSYIDGLPAWQLIKQRNTVCQINTTMVSLKNILSINMQRIPFLKKESLTTTAKTLAQASRALAPYDQKKIIDASLQDACRSYRYHRLSFTRQLLHNNINLTNILIHKKTVYVLDLSHIREDHSLSDLASLVISCLFFNIPVTTIKTVVKNYFTQHKIETEHFQILNTLIKIGLIQEYLKNIQREKSIGLSTYPPSLVRAYMSSLSKRKKSITAVLKKMNNNPRITV